MEDLLERRWLFVTGLPRSGTALCQHLLNLHPSCHIVGEFSPELCLLRGLQPGIRPTSMTAQFSNALGEFVEHEWPFANVTTWAQMACPHEPAVLVRHMMAGLRSLWPTAEVFGCRNPTYTDHWRTLRSLFPDCRLVVMERPLEDCLESILRKPDWWDADLCPGDEAGKQAWRLRHEEPTREVLQQCEGNIGQCEDAHRLPLADLNAQPSLHITTLLAYAGLDPRAYPWGEAYKRFEAGARLD